MTERDMVIYYPHTPVMLRPCVEALVKDSSGVYVMVPSAGEAIQFPF